MSSASTIGLPFLKSAIVAPTFTSTVPFDFLIENTSSIPVGNYLVWTYLYIQGDVNTALGQVVTNISINGAPFRPNTFNAGGIDLNNNSITFQSSQIVIVSIEQPQIILQSTIVFFNNAPTISGTIFFLPI
jgi:hypothetical protein